MLNKKKGLSIYEKRWLAAIKFFEDFKQQILDAGGDFFTYDEEYVSVDKLIIHENEIYIKHSNSNSSTFLFENDKEYDHGLHTPIDEYQKEFLSRVKVYKEIKIKIKRKK